MWKTFNSVHLSPFCLSLFCLLLLVAVFPALAQTPPPAAPAPPPKPPTLASVLAATTSVPSNLVLVVGADKAGLPKEAVLPPAPASFSDIASAFGYQLYAFGSITALAPATTVALNTEPATPSVAADIAPYQAIKLLAATLDDAQWHALTSEAGIGLSDLSDDTQRGLFHALFNDGQFFVASDDPDLRKLPENKRTDIQDMTDKMDSVRLRMGQTAYIYVHDKAGKTVFFGDSSADKTPGLTTYRPKHDPPGLTHGVALRATVPNSLKAGDLNLSAPSLQAPVSLTGLRTVGQLTTRIGTVTHTELYADPRYAARVITLLGQAPPPAVPAADLLRTLCLCLCGTVRRVGPAFVLTDDLVGVGVRRQLLSEWNKKSRASESAMTDAAGRALLARHGSEIRQVPSFGNSMALTPEQIKTEKLDDSIPQVPGFNDNTVPYAQLTPAQQDTARRIAAGYTDKRASGTLPGYLSGRQTVAPNPTVSLNPQMHLQLLVPTLSAPVEAPFGTEDMMFFVWPGDDMLYANSAAAQKKKPATPPKPAPPLGPLLRAGAHRALLASPRTAADIDALIPVMHKLGLNELYLDVFSDGVARIAGTPLSPAKSFDGPDILSEALKLGKAAHIAVYADMNLLTWGDNPPASLADPNILGENTNEAAVRRHAIKPETERDDDGTPLSFTPPAVDVNPVAARSTLLDVVSAIAAVPGLAGFVWQGSVPDTDVGYTPAARLAFLRARHADPLDIDSVARYDLPSGVDLPQFDNDAVDSALRGQWDDFHKASILDTLRAVRRAATLARPLPVLMQQDVSYWRFFATWDNPRLDPPPLRHVRSSLDPDDPNIDALARAQGHLVLQDVSMKDAVHPDALAYRLAPETRASPRGSGFVLDFGEPGATRGAHPLEALVQAAQPPHP